MTVIYTKVCEHCGQVKLLTEFHFRNDNQKYRPTCIECTKEKQRNFRKNNREDIIRRDLLYRTKYPWRYILKNIKTRCTNPNREDYKTYGSRGIECRITEAEIKELWFRDKAYDMKKPSIDRIDNDWHYEYSNCRFIEMPINAGKDKNKPILQYDLDGNFVREWTSITIAATNYNIHRRKLNAVLLKNKPLLGFIWKYKEKGEIDVQ